MLTADVRPYKWKGLPHLLEWLITDNHAGSSDNQKCKPLFLLSRILLSNHTVKAIYKQRAMLMVRANEPSQMPLLSHENTPDTCPASN